jgi:uncharacterized protein (UPF0548 family)
MLTLFKPSADRIQRILDIESPRPWSYSLVGVTRDEPLAGSQHAGFAVDRLRSKLGDGIDTFEKAVAALQRWDQFQLGWTSVSRPDTPLEPGRTVGVLAHVGLWSLNVCRIIYRIDEPAPQRRFGFGYGTLPHHVEEGEERFTIEHAADGSVWYEILAVSRPRHWLARSLGPLSRAMQARFRRDSTAAMLRAAR